jgi:hypothetical protein
MKISSNQDGLLVAGASLLGVLLIVGLLCLALWFRAWGPGEATVRPGPSTPTPTSWPSSRMASPEYGLQAHLWWDEAVARRDMDLIADAGFGWVKQNVGWRDVEGAAKGSFNWYFTDRILDDAEKRGLKVLFRLDSEPAWAALEKGVRSRNGPPEDVEDFGDFCHALAERYTGRVDAYQVWNEPNLAREWGGYAPDAAEYVELLRACTVGVKTADPDALVVSAGLAPTGTGLPEAIPDTDYLVQMYEAGAAPYFDALGVNAPGYKAPPEVSPEEAAATPAYGGQRFFCFRHVEDMREIMVAHGDGDKQVMILEMGWTIDPRPESPYHWHAVTPEQKADYLVRAFEYAEEHWSPWIGLMNVLSIADHRWTPESEQYWWAVTEPSWPETEVRPAYEALRAMEK